MYILWLLLEHGLVYVSMWWRFTHTCGCTIKSKIDQMSTRNNVIHEYQVKFHIYAFPQKTLDSYTDIYEDKRKLLLDKWKLSLIHTNDQKQSLWQWWLWIEVRHQNQLNSYMKYWERLMCLFSAAIF